ncbi:hypothetical protein K492DRAFT_197713, partial [Lichtheimia hyalospora FSU 10163]
VNYTPVTREPGVVPNAAYAEDHYQQQSSQRHMSYLPQLNPGPVAQQQPPHTQDSNPFRRTTQEQDLASYALAQQSAAAHHFHQPSSDPRYQYF